jgi:ACT domain-containing protein
MKTIITVIGKDKPGIIARVSTRLFELNINILDVSQTIMAGNFTMIMLVDLGKILVSFDEVKTAMNATAEEIEVKISVQREAIFNAMHRV